MSFANTFQAAEGPYIAQVLAQTWGYPKPGIKYPVSITFAFGAEGDMIALRSTVPDDCANPFYYDDRNDWLWDLADADKIHEGNVYHWEGYYLKFKTGGYRFTGNLCLVLEARG